MQKREKVATKDVAEEKAFDPKAMDDAAREAEAAFDALPKNVKEAMAVFWFGHYTKAGHKRLGRMLVAKAKKIANGTGK